MRKLDYILRNWRASKAIAHIRPGDRLLDVGCFDGWFLERVRSRVCKAAGIDPHAQPRPNLHRDTGLELLRDTFPGSIRLKGGQFTCITMLAVLEHVPDPAEVAAECFRVLEPGGRVVLSVPSPRVDEILRVLRTIRLIDGMMTEEHHHFDVEQTASIFQRSGFELKKREKFQLGLNNLFVFEKPRVCSASLATTSHPSAARVGDLVPAMS